MYKMSLLSLALCLAACVPPADDTADDTGDGFACGGTIVLELEDLPSSFYDGVTWEEDGVTLTLLANPSGDFNAGIGPDGDLWLYLGTVLRAEPSCDAAEAEVDTVDYCNGACVIASAFEGDVEVASATSVAGTTPQTLVLDGAGARVDAVEIAGAESPMREIRLYE